MSDFPSECELYKHALLKQIGDCFLFLKNNEENLTPLKQLLELPGNDPSRDSKAILFKWAVSCLINKAKNSDEQPKVPLDFSRVHPALSETSELSKLAEDEDPSVLMDLVKNFSYEFFKTLKTLGCEEAVKFCEATANNHKIPLHLVGRFISSFKVSAAPFNFSPLLEERCQNIETMSELYEGLLCDVSAKQVESAEVLSNYFDPFMEHDALMLANQAIRVPCHWVDTSGALCTRLFPSFTILNFLFQVETMNGNEMMKRLKKLPVTPITSKFKNQIILAQVLGLGDDWEPLSKKSIPSIISPEYITEGVLTLPRDTEFITIPKSSWEADFDFIEGYLAIISELDRSSNEIIDFPLCAAEDIFSLLTVKDADQEIPLKKTEKILEKLSNCVPKENELSKYIEIGIKKAKAIQFLYPKCQKKQMFLPFTYLYDECPDDKLSQLTKIIEDPTKTVISRMFKNTVNEKIPAKKDKKMNYVFDARYNEKTEDSELMAKVAEILKTVPKEFQTYAILDLALSKRRFTGVSKLCQDERFKEIVENALNPGKTYPDVSNFTFYENTSTLQRKIQIINNQMQSGKLVGFSNYINQLSRYGTSRYLKVPPETFITKTVMKAKSIAALVEEFQKADIDLIAFIYSNIEASSLKKQILLELIRNEPYSGLIYSLDCLEPGDVLQIFQTSVMQKYLASSKTFSDLYPYVDGKAAFVKTGDVFLYNENEDLVSHIPELLCNINSMKVDDAMEILNDLVLQFDLRPYLNEILMITKKFPAEKCLGFLETYAEMFSPESDEFLILYKKIDSLKENDGSSNEFDWKYVLDITGNFTECYNNPEKIYNSIKIYLARNSFKKTFVQNILNFAAILIIIRSKGFFKSREEETKWLVNEVKDARTINDVFNRLNENIIVKMIVDLAVSKDVLCMVGIAKQFDSKVITKRIIPYILKCPKIVLLLPETSQRDAALVYVINNLYVNTMDGNNRLCLIINNFEKYISPESSYVIQALKEIVYGGIYSHFGEELSVKSVKNLLRLSIKYDFIKAREILENNGVTIDMTQYYNDLTYFGLAPSSNGIDLDVLYLSPDLPFKASSLIPNIHNIKSDFSSTLRLTAIGNKLAVYNRKADPINVKRAKVGDFEFYDISSSITDVRIFDNKYSRMSFASESGDFTFDENSNISDILTEAIAFSELPDLFNTALEEGNLDLLRSITNIFDENCCLFGILALTSWTLQHREVMEIFSGEKDLSGEDLEDFVIAVKETLAAASDIYETVDPSVLLPPGSIKRGDKKVLDDIRVIINYQKQVMQTNEKSITLLSTADKGNAVTQLLIISDYDKAFTLMRALGVDVNDVMIEAAAYFGQKSNVELCDFLVNVIPRMDVNDANNLIEALASILVGNKFDDVFIKSIIAGIEEPRNAFRILRWFGLTDTAALIALQNGLKEEIEVALKDSKLKKGIPMIRACVSWLSRHQHMNQLF